MAAGAEEQDDEAWARGMVRGLSPMSQADVEGLECIRGLIDGDCRFTAPGWRESA